MSQIENTAAYTELQKNIDAWEASIEQINCEISAVIKLLSRGVPSFSCAHVSWDSKAKQIKRQDGHDIMHSSVKDRVRCHGVLGDILRAAPRPAPIFHTHTPSPRTDEQWDEKRAQYREDGWG